MLNNPFPDVTDILAIKAKTDNLPASPAATGAQMNLVNAPNATAITAIQSGLATAAALTSVAAEVTEIEKHFHTRARWFGKKTDQTNPANVWAADTLSPYRAISGANTYGAGANDEALVWGTANVMISGQTKLDLDKIMIVASSVTTIWKLRIVYGSGTMADAIAAGQYTETMVQVASASSRITKEDIRMPRITIGTDQVWVQGWNAADDATIDFLVGIHGYTV